MPMKAIIPIAGAGTRLRPFTYTQPKALIPVAGKPILGFIIEELQSLGIDEFVFIIGYLGEKVKSYVQEKHPDIKMHFATQEVRKGLGHAIHMAKDLIDPNEEVLIFLGDTIVEADLKTVLASDTSALGVKKVDDPRNFGVASVKEDGTITQVIEKPRFAKSNMALVGVYKIKESKALFEALDKIISETSHDKEEIHLADAIMVMIEQGIVFNSFRVNHWYDCGKVDILLATNRTLLEKNEIHSDPKDFDNTVIINPVSIAKSAIVRNSIIGPNVSIGEGSEISHSVVQDSIIGSFARLDQIILNGSLIGSDASAKGLAQSLNIGDNTDIDLSGKANA